MAFERQQTPNGADQLKDVSVYLRRADKLVKDGKYESALAEIIKARTQNPKNLYAIAYEERVRSILTKAREEGSDKPIVSQKTPELEQISSRAIAEAQRSAEAATRMQERIESLKRQEDETRQAEAQRRDAIRKKVTELFDRAQELFRNGEYNRALDEVARINMIDPSNEEVTVFEEKVRQEQESAQKRAEEERFIQQAEEEQRRREYLKKELARIKREGEEKRRKEEEARKKAQQQKVNQHLARAKKLFSEYQYEEARSELAFIIVIDPLNEEMITLEQQIRDAEEKRQAEEMERYRRQQAEQQKKREATQAKVRKQIETAETYLINGKYSDALRVIAAAYVLDPLNETLQACEERILKTQEEARQRAEEERTRKEEELRMRQEEEMRRLIQNAQKRAAAGENAEEETRKKVDKQKITGYLKRAQLHLDDERFENALGEVALAFVIDPFDDEVIAFEKNILDAQERKRSAGSSQQQEPETVTAPNDDVPQEEPVDEAELATPVGTLNGETYLQQSTEQIDEVKDAEVESQKSDVPAVDASTISSGISSVQPGHTKSAADKSGKQVAQASVRDTDRTPEDAEDALTEHTVPESRIAERQPDKKAEPDRASTSRKDSPKSDTPVSRRVRQPKSTVKHSSPKSDWEKKDEQIARHLSKARQYRDSNDFDKARDEIAKAFLIDPLNENIKDFDAQTQREHATFLERKKREKTIRTYINRAKMYAAQEDFDQAYEAIESGFKIDSANSELTKVKENLDEMQHRWKEAEELWEKVTTNEMQGTRSGRFDSKQLYKEALSNYHMKLEMLSPEERRTITGGKEEEPDIIDLESEIQDIYINWQKEQERRAEDERNEDIRKHLEKAKKLLLEESYEEALAEVAFGKMIDEENQELRSMEKAIWNDLNRKQSGKAHVSDGIEEDVSLRERRINVRIHLKAAESYAEKKQFAEALDEIAKAYTIDPLNDDIAACEGRIRHQADRFAKKTRGLS
jgi:hypothetical protein